MGLQIFGYILIPLLAGLALCFIFSLCSADYFYQKYDMPYKDLVQYFHGRNDLFSRITRILLREDKNIFNSGEILGTNTNRIICSLMLLVVGMSFYRDSYRRFVENDYFFGLLAVFMGLLIHLMIYIGWNYGRDMNAPSKKKK